MEEIKQLSKKWKFLMMLLVFLTLVALTISGVLINKARTISNIKNPPQNNVSEVVSEISSFMVLPDKETPTLATVTDPSKLAGQPFFQNAEVGDLVLIYTNSKRAILWRPSIKKIVEVTTLNVSAGEVSQ